MERKDLVVCTVVGLLGILSAALGFAAEAKRIKVSDEQKITPGECIYPGNPAVELGRAAVVVLVIAQTIIYSVPLYICCKKHPHPCGTNWTVGLISLVISWFTYIIACHLLLTGDALNDHHGAERIYYLGNYCYIGKPGVFAGGAVLSLATVSLGIIYYYFTLSSSKNMESSGAQQNQGITLGQPQIPPPQSTQPVFVHEDTYRRQQQFP